MIVANFTGGEAEDLRRAMGFKRSEARMREIAVKLRSGMDANGISGKAQESIIQSISSFALYGFPESHAASFALLAYASAYLKCHYLAAFTAAILNNQPMGFYAPATLVKDAQRHGLHFRPIDVTRSDWLCTIEDDDGAKCVRLGLNYVKGVREETARAILVAQGRSANSVTVTDIPHPGANGRKLQINAESRCPSPNWLPPPRPFTSIQDLVDRVPGMRKDELRALAEVGALNFINGIHRRDALWQAELAMRPAGPLFAAEKTDVPEPGPLAQMTDSERLNTDFRRTHLSIGRHPMAFHRERMNELGVVTASELKNVPHGRRVRTAGCVICRQRPGTAKGLVFLSVEDETGVSNSVVMPDVYAEYRTTLLENAYLLIEGELQNIDNVVTVKVAHMAALHVAEEAVPSHDFH